MKRLHAFAFASAALVVAVASGCDDSVEDATGGAGTTSSTTKATGTGTTSATGSTTSATTATGSGSSSSGTTPMPFECGSKELLCDPTKEYCEQFNGFSLMYSCKPHAPCPGSDTVTCSCLNVAGMMCNSCMTKDGTALMDCGQG